MDNFKRTDSINMRDWMLGIGEFSEENLAKSRAALGEKLAKKVMSALEDALREQFSAPPLEAITTPDLIKAMWKERSENRREAERVALQARVKELEAQVNRDHQSLVDLSSLRTKLVERIDELEAESEQLTHERDTFLSNEQSALKSWQQALDERDEARRERDDACRNRDRLHGELGECRQQLEASIRERDTLLESEAWGVNCKPSPSASVSLSDEEKATLEYCRDKYVAQEIDFLKRNAPNHPWLATWQQRFESFNSILMRAGCKAKEQEP